jgi:hypothetical protein
VVTAREAAMENGKASVPPPGLEPGGAALLIVTHCSDCIIPSHSLTCALPHACYENSWWVIWRQFPTVPELRTFMVVSNFPPLITVFRPRISGFISRAAHVLSVPVLQHGRDAEGRDHTTYA